MNLFEYLDRKNKRRYLKKMIKDLEYELQAERQCLFLENHKNVKDVEQWLFLIRETEQKISSYQDKLNDLL